MAGRKSPIGMPPFRLFLSLFFATFMILAANSPAQSATIIVANTDDSGPGSLRQAILDSTDQTNVIDAQGVSGTITLTTGYPEIEQNLAILGPPGGGLTVSGNGAVGVFVIQGGTVTFSNLTIRDGSVSTGGGGILNYADLTLNNCTISGNQDSSSSYGGGGIYNALGASLSLNNCTITGNTASEIGGGIYNAGSLTLSNCTLSGNTALNETGYRGGGGIYSDSTNSFVLTNCTVSGNAVSGSNSCGGGICNGDGGFGVTLTNCTVTQNTASDGAGYYSFASANEIIMKNTILSGNTGNSDIWVWDSTFVSESYNLLGTVNPGASSLFTGTGDILSDSPGLSSLADNGGPTWTHALLPTSPALDAGTNDGAPSTDQRGESRPQDGNSDGLAVVDIGAYESPDLCVGNVAPIANGQTVTGSAGETQVSITLSGSDEDGPSASLTYEVVSNPTYGNLTGDPPELTYERAGLDVYTDSFTFLVNDGCADSLPATVNIEFSEPTEPSCEGNVAPIANGQTVTGSAGETQVSITLSGSDEDGPSASLTYEVVSNPTYGNLTGDPPELTYERAGLDVYTDSFTFKVYDGCTWSDSAVVDITFPVPTEPDCDSNPPPTAHGQYAICWTVDKFVQITLSGSDQEDETLTYEVVSDPSHGTLTGIPPALTYKWDGLGATADSFTFRVNDGCHNSSTATVDVEMVTDIAKSNAPAVAHRKFYDAGLTGSVACTLSGSDFDEDPLGDPLKYEVVEGPSNGTLSGNEPNLIYQTDLTSGTDIFYYRVTDNRTDLTRYSEADSVYIYIGEDFKVTGLPPVADAGPDMEIKRYVEEGQTPSGTWSTTLNGSKSYDPAGRPLTYHWTPGGGWLTGSAENTVVGWESSAEGTTTCTLTVTNSDNQSATDSVKVKVPAYDSLALALLAGFCALVGVRYVRRGARENG